MGKINEDELKELFIEMKKNNTSAFDKIYTKYNKLIYGIAFSILKNREDSEDIVHAVFSKIYTLEKEKFPAEKIGTWLYTVTKNEALLFLRKKDNSVNLEAIYNLKDENNDINNYINIDSYNRLIKGLDKKEQEIISLKILSNLTFKEIAELLGESINTIKWRYYKAIYTLKITLGNLSMFIITFVLGTLTLKEHKKDAPTIQEEQSSSHTEIEGKEDSVTNYNEIIQESDETNSLENVIVQQNTHVDTTNYLSIGMFSISGIFLILTIIFAIFWVNYQLKVNKKASI